MVLSHLDRLQAHAESTELPPDDPPDLPEDAPPWLRALDAVIRHVSRSWFLLILLWPFVVWLICQMTLPFSDYTDYCGTYIMNGQKRDYHCIDSSFIDEFSTVYFSSLVWFKVMAITARGRTPSSRIIRVTWGLLALYLTALLLSRLVA